MDLTAKNIPQTLADAEAEINAAERIEWAPDAFAAMERRARVFGGYGWNVAGAGLWRDRNRAEVVGHRWAALATRTAQS